MKTPRSIQKTIHTSRAIEWCVDETAALLTGNALQKK